VSDDAIAQVIVRLRAGDPGALDALFPMIYEELKRVARAQLAREDVGHTLGPTALVHEAYMNLARWNRLEADDRAHFLNIAARAMRRILIDHARAHKRAKRDTAQGAALVDEIQRLMTENSAEELIALDDALERLSAMNPRAALVVERRFFAGLTLEETATTLNVSLKTVQRDWLTARAWLRKEIDRELSDPPATI
jgi:RNA polymerase sigma factor (TIGR02999 family)